MCSFVFLLFRTLYFNLIPFFFRDASMAYILFIGYMRLSTHLVLRILSNPRIYIVVLLYKSLSNPNILIGLYRLFFFLSRVDNHLCFINVRMCLFLCSAHIELGSLKGQIHMYSYLKLSDWFKIQRMIEKKKNRCNFLSKANMLFCICMSLIPLQATCHFTFNKSSISDLYTYFSREWESRKVSTCYRSKRAFGDLETFVTGELKSHAKSTLIEHPKAN